MCMIYESHRIINEPMTVYAVRIKIDDNFCKSPFKELLWRIGVERIEEDFAESMCFYYGMEIGEGFFHVMKTKEDAELLAMLILKHNHTNNLAVYECEVSANSIVVDGKIPIHVIGAGMECYAVTRLKVVRLLEEL